MKKNLILAIFFFVAGFLTHAMIFPDFLANGIVDVQKIALPNTVPTQTTSGNRTDFETKITYDGKNFNRTNVSVGVGTYLFITNISKDKHMWLVSDNELLTTVRNYGESEQVKAKMEFPGRYVVGDKNNPDARLIITVK